ncbi:MAG TPA: uroporphyrinogen-III C-methyltransferase, partial [Phycisphaerae bacterium]|nr:uroporphyrinogen-III C-methyltransferase [Phycisphaerae bacterium]
SGGCVYLVGAGPGDPGLITVRGRDLLSQADVVVYDRLVAPRLLECARPDAELIYAGKQPGTRAMSQEQINELLISRARGGAGVVRLKGGDPFVFGRGGEEALALAEAGIRFEVVPGVTAGVAAPAYAGIPVTHRMMAGSFAMATGQEATDKDAPDLDYDALARWKGTLEFYMGVRNLEPICKALMDHGLSGETPAAVIQWGTTPRQHVIAGPLHTLPSLAAEADVTPPAMIIIGEVVRLRERLAWFERRPLFGRRVVVTRARAQASGLAAKLESLGAEVVEMPTIRIEPAEDPAALLKAVGELDSFDWIVFTSVNAVDALSAAIEQAGLDSRALHGSRICAIGPATAERLGRFGLRADAQPEKFATAEIVNTLVAIQDLTGARVLCPRSDVAPADLADALTARGALVRAVTAYRTVPDCTGAERVAEMLANDETHWITFTSSSTVRNFFRAVAPEAVRSSGARLASIGPATSAALAEVGFAPSIEADPHTTDGVVDAILTQEAAGEGAP